MIVYNYLYFSVIAVGVVSWISSSKIYQSSPTLVFERVKKIKGAFTENDARCWLVTMNAFKQVWQESLSF